MSLQVDGRVVQVNETFLAWTGYRRDRLVGHADFASLLTVGGRVLFETHCMPLLLGGRTVEQVSLDIRRADGTPMAVLFGATIRAPIADAEHPVIRASFVDLSQRRLFEEQLVSRNDALSRSNEELDAFAHAAAHDLQAPLRGIRQNTEFFLEDAGELAPASRELLETVVRLSGRMKAMLDDLLAYALAGRSAWHPEEVSLRGAVDEVLDLMGTRADGAEVTVADASVTIDAGVLRQLLLNLVGNALKYSGAAGPARVEVGVCGFADAPARPPGSPALNPALADAPVVAVADRGIGIDARDHERVFDLFRQLDPGAEGSGSGLALCRALCRSQGGDVWLTSEPGAGTTVYALCAVAT